VIIEVTIVYGSLYLHGWAT